MLAEIEEGWSVLTEIWGSCPRECDSESQRYKPSQRLYKANLRSEHEEGELEEHV